MAMQTGFAPLAVKEMDWVIPTLCEDQPDVDASRVAGRAPA
jgi:hypothetical protein